MNKITGSLDLIKKVNRSLVLETIRNNQPISRAGISKKTSLSRSTVSSIVEELLLKRLVIELGYGDSTQEGGRRGVELGFNPKSAYGVGVDIGGTKIFIVITDLDGGVVYREKLQTTTSVAKIIEMIKQTIRKADIQEKNIVGMGVGVPGTTNSKEGLVIDAPALKWSNLQLKSQLQEHFLFPIYINNDVNCAALGEHWLGSGKNSNDILFIAIGTGVGSAIITNGELIHGFNYQAGEIAYNINEEDVRQGRQNKLGEFGILEKKICGESFAQFGYSSSELFNEYTMGNEKVIPVIERFILELSINIVNCINLVNPEHVIIGGGVSESMNVIIERIQHSVDCLTPIKTNIELASLGGEAGGLGAVAYAFKEVNESSVL